LIEDFEPVLIFSSKLRRHKKIYLTRDYYDRYKVAGLENFAIFFPKPYFTVGLVGSSALKHP